MSQEEQRRLQKAQEQLRMRVPITGLKQLSASHASVGSSPSSCRSDSRPSLRVSNPHWAATFLMSLLLPLVMVVNLTTNISDWICGCVYIRVGHCIEYG